MVIHCFFYRILIGSAFCVLLFQLDAHTRTSILTFLMIMAQSESNANDKYTADTNDGARRLPFELAPVKIAMSDYTTPPNRSVWIFQSFEYFSFLFHLEIVKINCIIKICSNAGHSIEFIYTKYWCHSIFMPKSAEIKKHEQFSTNCRSIASHTIR